MLNWRQVEDEPAPKDRLILVTAGWGWRREDTHTPQRRFERTKRVIPARHDKYLKPIGAALLVYWSTDVDKYHLERTGGLWIVAGKGTVFFEPFRWWADVNNPLTPERMAGHDPTFLVSNVVPKVDDLTPYVPSEDEMKARRVQEMMRG